MKSNIKYGKILLVVFITLLIWVWADKAQDVDDDFFSAVIRPDLSAAQELWLTFDGKPNAVLEKLVLRGPASRIDTLRRQWQTGAFIAEFFLSVQQLGLAGPGEKDFDVAKALNASGQLRKLGVTAVSSEPGMLRVKASELVERTLLVRCVDRSGSLLRPMSVEPEKVEMRVPADWGPEKLVAEVSLGADEIKQAQVREIGLTARVKLAENNIRAAKTLVKVRMPAGQEDLINYPVSGATVGFVFSANLVGKFKPTLLNMQDLDTVYIKATPKAKNAYQAQRFKMLLFIYDGDEKKQGEQSREVVYNWPEEFAGTGEIELNQEPAAAKFILESIKSQ
jgi:hypothetical protein